MKYITLLIAFIFGLHVVSHAQNSADNVGRVRSTLQNAIALFEKSGTDSTAIFKLDSVLTVAKQTLKNAPTNPSKEEATTYTLFKSTLVQFFIAIGKIEDAKTENIELLSFARMHNDAQTIIDYEYIMGSICDKLNERQEAAGHYNESARIAIELKEYGQASRAELGAATAYHAIEQFDKSLNASKLTIKYGELDNNNSSRIGGGWNLIGAVYFAQQKYDQSIEAYEQAVLYFQKAGEKTLQHVAQSSIDYILAQTGKAKPVVEKIVTREKSVKMPVLEVIDTLEEPFKNSYEAMKAQQMISEFDAADKQAKLDILREDYIDKQTQALRARVWYVSGLSLLVIIALILLYARQRQKRKAEIEKTQKYIAGLESERERISKELHDGVCNDLLAIEMELKNKGVSTEQLSRSRESVRNISHELLPPEFQHATIDEILSDYISRLKAGKITISYHSTQSTEWNEIDTDVAFAIYRIVQEALSNGIKHSGATKIEVELSKSEENLSVTISDNGSGIRSGKKTKGAGLKTIKERTMSAGGELDITSSGQGTVIKIIF